MKVKTIQQCRLCQSKELIPLFSLGSQYVSDFVKSPKEQGIKCPISLVLCPTCTLVQLRDTAPQEILYSRHYWYRSGVNYSMRTALLDVTKQIEQTIDLDPGDVVCDIGSNDGTLLRSYGNQHIHKVGVEPANNLVEEGSVGVDTFIHDFWSEAAYYDVMDDKAKVITAIGMFYDLDDPNQFIADVASCLRDDGLFVAQLMCLKNMLDLNDVGNLAHEHLEFYSFKSLNYLFNKHGLEIVDVTTNSVNGRSYRILAVHKGSSVVPPNLGNLNCVTMNEIGLDDPELYKKFFSRIEENKEKVIRFIKDKHKMGKTIWVYGASTKGNVILQYFGLDNTLIDGAADRSKYKWGRYTIGSGIPIYSEEMARSACPDYFLVLPYSFIDEFVQREQEWTRGGGRFIVPIPEMRLVP